MAFTPKDAIDAARDIVANAVERSSDIVEDAGHIIKGDIAGGTAGGPLADGSFEPSHSDVTPPLSHARSCLGRTK